jgi:hypothetical protein
MEATPVPDWVQESAEEGKWHEERIKNELREKGNVVYSEQEELRIEQPTFILVGHIDGKNEDTQGNLSLLEVKSMSQFQYAKWIKGGFMAFPHYAGQLACYFTGSRMDNCLYAVKNRNNGQRDFRLVNKLDNKLFEIEPILEKIAIVEELAQQGKLYDRAYDIDDDECNFCEYKHLCLPEKKPLEEIDKKVLEDAIEQYRLGKQLENRANEIIEKAKEILQAYAKEQPEQKLYLNNLSVSYYTVPEAPISYIRKAYTACKIKDYSKEGD